MAKQAALLLVALTLATSLAVVAYLRFSGPQAVATAPASSLADFPLDAATRSALALPKALKEISGLAVVDETTLLAHNDENAVVYRVDLDSSEVSKWLVVGDPVLRMDIEGIATIGDDVYLIDSGGILVSIPGGVRRGGVVTDFGRIDTGLGSACEIEGLDADFEPGTLVIACKEMRDGSDGIAIFSFDVASAQARELFRLDPDQFERKPNPSGVTRAFGHYVLIAGRDRLIFEVTRTGSIVSVSRLGKKHHPQAEGIALLPSMERLLIADEGGGLTSYACPVATCGAH